MSEPTLPQIAGCPFAVFDEMGVSADDRVQDYAAHMVAAERERWKRVLRRATDDANRYGREGLTVSCTPSDTGAMLSWQVTPNDLSSADPKGSAGTKC